MRQTRHETVRNKAIGQKVPPAAERAAHVLETRQWMLVFAVTCQLVTLWITWRVWMVRDQPMNVPLLPLPPVSFLIPMVVTAIAVLFRPRIGLAAHAVVYLIAVLADQYRLQPQFFSLIVLMFACSYDAGPWFARWYLATMWIWTGVHKLLSAEWLGVESWSFLTSCGVQLDSRASFYVAIMIGAAEVIQGLLAVFRPRIAAIGCLVIHFGILLSLSPLMAFHNESVWPWNLATAVIGAWLLLQEVYVPRTRLRFAILVGLMILPAGYYCGVVNSRLTFLLYSGNLPRALHVGQDSTKRLDGWTGLTVPFPNSPPLFVKVFERQAKAGDKLHIADPRRWLPDRFFLKGQDGVVREVTRERFYVSDLRRGEVAGVEMDERNAVWHIQMAGGDISKDNSGLVESVHLSGHATDDRLFQHLTNIRNVRLLTLDGTSVTDFGLLALVGLWRLEVVELRGGVLTDKCLDVFEELPALRELQLSGLDLTNDGLATLGKLPRLQTLHVHCPLMDDRGLVHLRTVSDLSWLNLSDTSITGSGLSHLQPLKHLDWLNLSRTALDDEGLRQLGRLANLSIVELAETKISDSGLVYLRSLSNCKVLDLTNTNVTDDGLVQLAGLASLEKLVLDGTKVTAAGVQRLRTALPGCRVQWQQG